MSMKRLINRLEEATRKTSYTVEVDDKVVYRGSDQAAAEAAFTEYANRSFKGTDKARPDVYMLMDGKIVRNYSGEAISFRFSPKTDENEIAFSLGDLRKILPKLVPNKETQDGEAYLRQVALAAMEALHDKYGKGSHLPLTGRYDGRIYVRYTFPPLTKAQHGEVLKDAIRNVAKEV